MTTSGNKKVLQRVRITQKRIAHDHLSVCNINTKYNVIQKPKIKRIRDKFPVLMIFLINDTDSQLSFFCKPAEPYVSNATK